MAATLRTPVDNVTGVPLPIAPTSCEWLPVDRPEVADLHHGFHPRLDPRLLTVAGFALRNGWLQRVERGLHNEGPFSYHRFFAGPRITTDETDIFSRLIIMTAGYVPDDVIDMSRGEPIRRAATVNESEFLRTPSNSDPYGYRYLVYRYEPIRQFFRSYVTKQKLGDEHIKQSFLDEFFHTSKPERKRYLGHLLLVKAAEAATGDIGQKYRMLHRARLLHPAMPDAPFKLVKYKLGNDQQRTELIPILEGQLRAYYELQAA